MSLAAISGTSAAARLTHCSVLLTSDQVGVCCQLIGLQPVKQLLQLLSIHDRSFEAGIACIRQPQMQAGPGTAPEGDCNGAHRCGLRTVQS